jgi:hypothetical protein
LNRLSLRKGERFPAARTEEPVPGFHKLSSKGGTQIIGATDWSFVLTNLQASDADYYSVTFTNSCGSTASTNVFLTVNPAGVSLALYAGITIGGVAGFTYGIQYTTDLSNTDSWEGIANVTLNSTNGFWLDVATGKPAAAVL